MINSARRMMADGVAGDVGSTFVGAVFEDECFVGGEGEVGEFVEG